MDFFEIKIEKTAFGGDGVGHIDGKVVFVPGTIPGETVKIFIKSEKKDYLNGRLTEIIEASPDRIEPVCPFAVRPVKKGVTDSFCPGCSYQHMTYAREVAEKQSQFSEMLARLTPDYGNILESPAVSDPSLGYRNKLTLHASSEEGEVKLGYFMEDNQTVLDIPQCPLARPEINAELAKRRSDPGFSHTLRDKMTFTMRFTGRDGVVCWRNKPGIKLKELTEDTAAGPVKVPPGSFFQINRCGMDALIEKVVETIKKSHPDNVIDLYCGAGLFSVAAAPFISGKLTGIDCDPDTIKTASQNAGKLAPGRCKFIAARADKVIRDILNGRSKSGRTLLITDPPRAGLDAKTREAVAYAGPEDIIYISCAPDTLCRDLDFLLKESYRVASARMVDMFPRTSHFESVTYLEKQ